jgi:hypothetical protein
MELTMEQERWGRGVWFCMSGITACDQVMEMLAAEDQGSCGLADGKNAALSKFLNEMLLKADNVPDLSRTVQLVGQIEHLPREFYILN